MTRQSFDAPSNLFAGRRMIIGLLTMQLLGAVVCVALAWPALELSGSSPPPFVPRIWFGAALASPIGFLVGRVWQVRSAPSVPGFPVGFLATLSLLLAATAVGLLIFGFPGLLPPR